MNNRSAGPRSFNTLQRSNRSARLKRLQEARILLLTICALILVLALTGLVFTVLEKCVDGPAAALHRRK